MQVTGVAGTAGYRRHPLIFWTFYGLQHSVRAERLARVEERRDQREYLAGPPCHADVRGPREHCELRVRQEFEHLHHVRQR
jgi:hypothetical protein